MINYKNYIGLPYKCRGRGPKYFDCYGLCKKIYKELENIELPNYLEIDYGDKWYIEGKNHILENITENFISVTEPYKLHDLIILYNGKTIYPNHVAVWIGNDKILHIYENSTSHIDRYSGYWKSKLFSALRWINNG